MKRILAALLALGILLVGCTGNSLSADQRKTLDDLYTTTGGLYAHWKLGLFMESYHKGIGAKESHIEMPMPFSRKRADYVAVFDEGSKLVAHVYEFKPISNRSGSRLDSATTQLDGYLTLLLKNKRLSKIKSGRKFVADGDPVVVPHEFTPELVARCMQMKVQTYRMAPGLVFYWFTELNGTHNGRNCGKRTRDEKSTDIGSFLHHIASTTIPRNYKVTYAQLRLAQIYAEEGVDDLRQAIYFPFEENQHPDRHSAPSPADRSEEVRKYLMGREVPLIFKSAPQAPVPFPGRNDGQKWECTTYECG